MITVRDIDTGVMYEWDMKQILHEINRDRSESWRNYVAADWFEGWEHWVEGITYSIVWNAKNERKGDDG